MVAKTTNRWMNEPSTRGVSGATRKTLENEHDNTFFVLELFVDDHAEKVEGLKEQFANDNQIQCVGNLPSAAKLLEE